MALLPIIVAQYSQPPQYRQACSNTAPGHCIRATARAFTHETCEILCVPQRSAQPDATILELVCYTTLASLYELESSPPSAAQRPGESPLGRRPIQNQTRPVQTALARPALE